MASQNVEEGQWVENIGGKLHRVLEAVAVAAVAALVPVAVAAAAGVGLGLGLGVFVGSQE